MRITLLMVLGFFLIAGTGFFLLMRTLREDIGRQYAQASEEPLVDFAHLFAGLLEQDLRDGALDVSDFRAGLASAQRRPFLAKIHQLEKSRIPTQVYVTDANGVVIFDSDGGRREGQDYSRYNDVLLARQGGYGARASRDDPSDPRSTVFYVAVPLRHREQFLGTLTVSRPERAMAPFVEESRALVLHSSVITGLWVFALAALWASFVLRPIRTLTRHALSIAAGERSTVPETGMGGLRSLSRALETMRSELEGRHYVENYVRALTHELKSPLAAIRGAAELVDESMPEEKRRRFLDLILAETSRSEDMVRHLVQLAAVESRTGLETREEFDLASLVRAEVGALAPAAETRGIVLSLTGDGKPLPVTGDPLMARIALRNLLNNAIDFSPAGEPVEVVIEPKGSGRAVIQVLDRGPGIPDYARDRVFDRFYSLKNETTGRKGAGIGLTFVKAAMELHGGDARLENREGGGAAATLHFES